MALFFPCATTIYETTTIFKMRKKTMTYEIKKTLSQKDLETLFPQRGQRRDEAPTAIILMMVVMMTFSALLGGSLLYDLVKTPIMPSAQIAAAQAVDHSE